MIGNVRKSLKLRQSILRKRKLVLISMFAFAILINYALAVGVAYLITH